MRKPQDSDCIRHASLCCLTGVVTALAMLASSDAVHAQAARLPTTEPTLRIDELERLDARVGRIEVVVQNVFDAENPEESKRLYRWANRVHVLTRESVVRNVLLFESGDALDARLLQESARLLRRLDFLVEASVVPIAYRESTNEVDVRVTVRDAWNLSLDLKLSRSGGANEFGLGIEDSNLFGSGKDLSVSYSSDVDRDEASFGYGDPNVRGSRVALGLQHAQRSDGDLSALAVGRPFFALDTRWSVAGRAYADERIDPMYDLGETVEEYRHESREISIEGGWSRGLIGRRSLRWLAGFAYEEDRFATTEEYPAPTLLPLDRKLAYPWVGLQVIADDFRVMSELNDMGRTEDVPLGLNLTARIGFASETFGADRDATLLSLDVQKGWEPGGPGRLLLLEATAATRDENGTLVNSIISAGARYYHRNLQNHLFSASLNATTSNRLDAENQVLLGGDSGLRGYPLRYQSGKHSAVLTLEQRFYTDLYPFRLFRVAYAAFFDAGRVWGQDPRGTPSLGMLYDIGVGLRLSSPRSSGRQIVHVDLAFPLRHDDSVDDVQLVIGTKRSF